MRKTMGIDIGGMSIKAGIVTEEGEILAQAAIPTEAETSTGDQIIEATAKLILSLAEQLPEGMDGIDAIGLGAPGTFDSEHGILLYVSNLPLSGMPICQMLSDACHRPVFLGNDANVAALAEARIGVGRDLKSSITVTIGTGIGSGVILNNRVYSGFNGAGCELGHTVIRAGGRHCGCGRNGCFEAYCSAASLIKLTQEAANAQPDSLLAREIWEAGEITGKTVFDVRAKGCPVAQQVVEDYLDNFAEGLANLVNAFFPEAIILGGGLSRQGDWLRADLEKRMTEKSIDIGHLPRTKVLLAKLGPEAGIVGAGFFAQDCLDDGVVIQPLS